MLEIPWACLLILSVFNREARPLALLMATNWALNYWYFENVSQWSPAIIDTLFAVPAVVLAHGIKQQWRWQVIVGSLVLTPVVHGWFWILYDARIDMGVQYYWFVVGLFSARVIALSGPGVLNAVTRLCSVVRHYWSGMAGLAGFVPASQGSPDNGTRGRRTSAATNRS